MAEGTVYRDARTSPPVKVSYPQSLFKPQYFPGKPQNEQTGRYSVVVMIDKNNKDEMAFMKQLYADLDSVLKEKWPDEANRPRVPLAGHDRSVFKDGDKACNNQGIPRKENNPEYAGHWIFTAATTTKPPVVDRSKNPILDANELWGGCRCHVSVNAYSFVQPQNKGVTLGLNGVQKWADGEERFGGGRPAVDDMFEAGSEGDPANYGDNPFGGNPFDGKPKNDPFTGASAVPEDGGPF